MILFVIYPIVVFILAILVILQPTGSSAVDMFGGGKASSVFSAKSSKGIMSKFTFFLVCSFFGLTFVLSGFYIQKAKAERDIITQSMKDELINSSSLDVKKKYNDKKNSKIKHEKKRDIKSDVKVDKKISHNNPEASNLKKK